MSSLNKRLRLATELVAIAGITNADGPSISISEYFLTILLDAKALSRVFVRMKVPKSRLTTSVSGDGNLHIRFSWKGAEWRAVVWAKDADEFIWGLEQSSPNCIALKQARIASPKQLALPLKEIAS